MCDCSDYEMPEFYNESTHTAKKPHTCCQCGLQIAPGQKYVKTAGKWDGRFESYKICQECDQLIRLLRHTTDFCCGMTDMIEAMRECDLIERDDETETSSSPLPFVYFQPHKGVDVPRLHDWGKALLEIRDNLAQMQDRDKSNAWWHKFRGGRVDAELSKLEREVAA